MLDCFKCLIYSYILTSQVDYNKLAALTGYTPGSASVTFGKIKRKLKAKAAGPSATPATPKKTAAGKTKTPKSGKRGAIEEAAPGTPSKKGKKGSEPTNDDVEEEFADFKVKKEEVADINGEADVFFKEAIAHSYDQDSI